MPQSDPAYIKTILAELHDAYPDPKIELEHWNSPIQLMVCVILSAQATDKGVNKITPALFKKYSSVDDFAGVNVEELMPYLNSINYYKTKAQRIIDACTYVRDHMNGKLTPDINELIKIPGIGRKSANVLLNEILDSPQGVVVDTHIARVSHRLELTSYDDQKHAVKIEQELMSILPKTEWRFYSSAVVLHGRYICKAKKPNCEECVLNKLCPSAHGVR